MVLKALSFLEVMLQIKTQSAIDAIITNNAFIFEFDFCFTGSIINILELKNLNNFYQYLYTIFYIS